MEIIFSCSYASKTQVAGRALTISLYQPVSAVYKSIIYALVKFPNSLQVVIKNLF